MMNKTMCATSKLLTLLIAILLYAQANAGILRLEPVPATITTLQGITTEKSVVTTTLQNTEATFLPKDIDEKLLITTTTTTEDNAEEDEDTTEIMVAAAAALSRDKEATVKLAAKKNPNLDAEVLKIDTHKSDDAELSKLLLLSVPKTSEKSRVMPAENIEEPKEISDEYKSTNHDDQSQITTTTVLPFETTTTIDNTESSTTVKQEDEEEEEDKESDSESESKSNEESIETTLANAAVLETEEESHVDNLANDGLDVYEYSDYVILDDHFENDVHLEPYVHSIEIVPPRFEGVFEDFLHDF